MSQNSRRKKLVQVRIPTLPVEETHQAQAIRLAKRLDELQRQLLARGTVDLPTHDPHDAFAEGTQCQSRAYEEPVPARLRVLIVDDTPLLIRSLVRMLKDFEVVAANGYQEAVERLLDAREHFDVVLCDLLMPDGTGMQLHARLLQERPDIVPFVVYMTANEYTPYIQEFLKGTRNRYLYKPLSRDMIREAVARPSRAVWEA